MHLSVLLGAILSRSDLIDHVYFGTLEDLRKGQIRKLGAGPSP